MSENGDSIERGGARKYRSPCRSTTAGRRNESFARIDHPEAQRAVIAQRKELIIARKEKLVVHSDIGLGCAQLLEISRCTLIHWFPSDHDCGTRVPL